jgi:hypothetical protein
MAAGGAPSTADMAMGGMATGDNEAVLRKVAAKLVQSGAHA